MAFLHYWIFGLANVIGNLVAQKVIVEKGIIKVIHKEKKKPDLTDDINDSYGEFPRAMKARLFENIRKVLLQCEVPMKDSVIVNGKVMPKQKKVQGRQTTVKEWTDNDMGLPKNSPQHTDKVQFVCMATLLRDIMDGILKYGWDPQIKRCGDSNHGLELYLR
jgi:hypothetical protein